MPDKLRVSFDFDGTLSEGPMRALAKKLLHYGVEVYITTARDGGGDRPMYVNDDIRQVAAQIGIPQGNVRYCAYGPKYEKLMDFDLHFDDDHNEVLDINLSSACIAVRYEPRKRPKLL